MHPLIAAENADSVPLCCYSYGTLCSDFKQSGLDAPDKPEKKPKGDEDAEDDKPETKGKGKAKEGGSKKKKPKGLFAIEWFRIGVSCSHVPPGAALTCPHGQFSTKRISSSRARRSTPRRATRSVVPVDGR